MREAIVSVRDEDGSALGLADFVDVFREGGLGEVEVVSCEGSRGVVRVEVDDAVDEDRLDESPGVTWWERIDRTGSGTAYLLGFDVEDRPNTVDACDENLVRCGAIDVNDGDFTFDVAGSQEAIADTVAEYEATGANVRLEALRDFDPRDDPLDALTARQREVVRVAFEVGYFDVPRSASTAEVAAELDLDASTVSEHLQRAEHNLLSAVLSPASPA